MSFACRRGNAPCWMKLRPERLFIQGLRSVVNGYEGSRQEEWSQAWNLYATELGTKRGRYALDALWNFAKTHQCSAVCPMGYHSTNCPFLCRDECLALLFAAAIQTENRESAVRCAELMFPAQKRSEAEQAAFRVALDFLAVGLRFLPVSTQLVDDIAMLPHAPTQGPRPTDTIH